jgi:hypothetical protein
MSVSIVLLFVQKECQRDAGIFTPGGKYNKELINNQMRGIC